MIRPRRGLCIPFTLAVGELAQPLQRAHPIAERKADQRQVVVGCPTARKLRAAARACPAGPGAPAAPPFPARSRVTRPSVPPMRRGTHTTAAFRAHTSL